MVSAYKCVFSIERIVKSGIIYSCLLQLSEKIISWLRQFLFNSCCLVPRSQLIVWKSSVFFWHINYISFMKMYGLSMIVKEYTIGYYFMKFFSFSWVLQLHTFYSNRQNFVIFHVFIHLLLSIVVCVDYLTFFVHFVCFTIHRKVFWTYKI